VSFFVNWTDEAGGEPQSSKAVASIAEAGNCVTYMVQFFRQKPVEIWIEDDADRHEAPMKPIRPSEIVAVVERAIGKVGIC
jgi:hypothetical protein